MMTDKADSIVRDRPHRHTLWVTRFCVDKPYQSVRVDQQNQDNARIGFYSGKQGFDYSFSISRKDAKLLARRIEQCLKATTKK